LLAELEDVLVDPGEDSQDKRGIIPPPIVHAQIVADALRPRKMTAQDLPLLVVVTGAPGSGKTTLAEALARELALPLLAKDDVKEALFDSLGTGDREWSRRLGRATYDVMFAVARRLLADGVSCLLESNFTDPAPLRALPAARVVQIGRAHV